MKPSPDLSAAAADPSAALRARAESAFLHNNARDLAAPSAAATPAEIPLLLHELRLHQIELEMKNEELRHAQAELDASRARYSDLYHLAPVGYCTLDAAGRLIETNLTLAALLGLPHRALLRQPFARFLAPADTDKFYLQLRQHLTSEAAAGGAAVKSLSGEWLILPPDGPPRLMHLTAAVAPEAGGAPTLRLVLSDITERTQLEEALREREEQHWAILQTAMAGFWLADARGQLLEVNETYCRMSGYDVHELLTMHISELEDPSTAAATAAHLQQVLAGDGRVFTCRHRRKDRTTFEVEVSFQFRPVEGGQLVVFLQDLSARRPAREGAPS